MQIEEDGLLGLSIDGRPDVLKRGAAWSLKGTCRIPCRLIYPRITQNEKPSPKIALPKTEGFNTSLTAIIEKYSSEIVSNSHGKY